MITQVTDDPYLQKSKMLREIIIGRFGKQKNQHDLLFNTIIDRCMQRIIDCCYQVCSDLFSPDSLISISKDEILWLNHDDNELEEVKRRLSSTQDREIGSWIIDYLHFKTFTLVELPLETHKKCYVRVFDKTTYDFKCVSSTDLLLATEISSKN